MCRQNSYLQIAEEHKIIQVEEELRKKHEATLSNQENLPEGDHVQSCVLMTSMKEILLENANLNSWLISNIGLFLFCVCVQLWSPILSLKTSQVYRSEVKSLSHVRLFATPWTVVYNTPPSMGLSRQEYWSGMPFPSPEDLLKCINVPNLYHSKGDQPWVFFGRNDAKSETPVLCHLMRRVDSLEKTLILGGIGGKRRRGWQRMRWLDGIINSMDMSLHELQSWWSTGRPGVLQFMGSQRVGHDWATELNWKSLWLSHSVSIETHFLLSNLLWYFRNGLPYLCWWISIIP